MQPTINFLKTQTNKCQYFLKAAELPTKLIKPYRHIYLSQYGVTPSLFNTPWNWKHDELFGHLNSIYSYGVQRDVEAEDIPIATGREHTHDEITISPDDPALKAWPYTFLNLEAVRQQIAHDQESASQILTYLEEQEKTLNINGVDVKDKDELISYINQMTSIVLDLPREEAWMAMVKAINTGEPKLTIKYSEPGNIFYSLKSWEGKHGDNFSVEFLITDEELQNLATDRNARTALKLLNQFGDHKFVWELEVTKKMLFISNLTRPIAVKNGIGSYSALNQAYNNISIPQHITVAPASSKFKHLQTENYERYCLTKAFYDIDSDQFQDIT